MNDDVLDPLPWGAEMRNTVILLDSFPEVHRFTFASEAGQFAQLAHQNNPFVTAYLLRTDKSTWYRSCYDFQTKKMVWEAVSVHEVPSVVKMATVIA